MKHLSFLFLLLLAASFRSSGQVSSSCIPSGALQKAYRDDVADMALQRIYALRSPDTQLIEIPQRYQDTIMGALAAVCNIGATYEADSVFRNYCVHRYHKFVPKIKVKVNPGISWVVAWRALDEHTGDIAIDGLLQRYGIKLSGYWYDEGQPDYQNDWAYFSSDRSINWKAFGDSLSLCRGISGYERQTVYGDGDRIEYTVDTARHLRFIAGRGDCPAGCTEYKSWAYTVKADCSVQTDGIVYRLQYDRYMPNCNLAPLAVSPDKKVKAATIQLIPNPVQSTLFLRHDGSGLRYSIRNVVGHQVLAGMYGNSGIDVSGLPAGFYLLSVQDDRGSMRASANFVKQ